MSIHTVFPPVEFCEAEQIMINEILLNDTFRKYLNALAREDAKELLSLSGLGLSDDELAKRHHIVEGKLAVISTLLSTKK